VRVYDLVGREVAVPAKGWYGPGYHNAHWNGRLSNGEIAPPGWYVARIRGKVINAAHMMLLLR
jgi:flagellar hook assembly protein FlgD